MATPVTAEDGSVLSVQTQAPAPSAKACANGATDGLEDWRIGCSGQSIRETVDGPPSVPPCGPPSKTGSICCGGCLEESEEALTEEDVECEPLLTQAYLAALLGGSLPQPDSEAPEDSPVQCAACSEPLDNGAGVRTECNRWFHPLCLVSTLDKAASHGPGCPACQDLAAAHGLASEQDEEVLSFVAERQASVLAAERAHDRKLADIEEICAQLPPDVFESPHTSTRLATLPFDKKQACMEQADATLQRLAALRSAAEHSVSDFRRSLRTFDWKAGTDITEDFVSGCVLRTSLVRACGEEGRVVFLMGRMKAIQTAIFSTMGFEEEGALISRGAGRSR